MSIQKDAAQALAEREEIVNAYTDVGDVQALEALRLMRASAEDKEKAALELAILIRKRTLKGELEMLAFTAEWWEKSAVPLAAAFPVFITFLASEKILDGHLRSKVLLASYLLGGLAWGVCRWVALKYGGRAKRGAADLGKVD